MCVYIHEEAESVCSVLETYRLSILCIAGYYRKSTSSKGRAALITKQDYMRCVWRGNELHNSVILEGDLKSFFCFLDALFLGILSDLAILYYT